MNYLQRYQTLLGLQPDGIIGPASAKAIMEDLGIENKLFFAHMMGQGKVESNNFTAFRENMNYSKIERLVDVWPTRFSTNRKASGEPNEDCIRVFNSPERGKAIANFVYGGREDLGNRGKDTNDGWFYRGGMLIQTTGRTNWLNLFQYLGYPLETDPDSLKDDVRAYFRSAVHWFEKNNAVKLCNKTSHDCILNVGRKVNLGNTATPNKPHKWEDRQSATLSLFKALKLV